MPLAIDHFGHICVEDCIRFARRMEPYNLAWIEDMVPWMYTDQYVRLRNSTTIPVCTGEDIYLKEDFEKLIKEVLLDNAYRNIVVMEPTASEKKYAEPTVASIVMSLESVFAVLGGALLLSQIPSLHELAGCSLMFAATVISQLPEKTK